MLLHERSGGVPAGIVVVPSARLTLDAGAEMFAVCALLVHGVDHGLLDADQGLFFGRRLGRGRGGVVLLDPDAEGPEGALVMREKMARRFEHEAVLRFFAESDVLEFVDGLVDVAGRDLATLPPRVAVSAQGWTLFQRRTLAGIVFQIGGLALLLDQSEQVCLIRNFVPHDFSLAESTAFTEVAQGAQLAGVFLFEQGIFLVGVWVKVARLRVSGSPGGRPSVHGRRPGPEAGKVGASSRPGLVHVVEIIAVAEGAGRALGGGHGAPTTARSPSSPRPSAGQWIFSPKSENKSYWQSLNDT